MRSLSHVLDDTLASYGAWIGRSSFLARILFIFGFCLMVAFFGGVFLAVTESDIEDLYVQKNSRIPHEYGVQREHWGGVSRSELTIHESPNGQVATKEALDAILAAITPLYKEDETDLCPNYDGIITARPAECDIPEYSTNIYCNCDDIASSPDQVSITVDNVDLTAKDFCESSRVPQILADTNIPSLKPQDPGFLSSTLYSNLIPTTLLLGGLSNTTISQSPWYTRASSAALAATESAFIANEVALENMGSRADYVSSGIIGGGAASAVLGGSFAVTRNSSLNELAMIDLFGTYLAGETNQANLEARYSMTHSAALATEAYRQLLAGLNAGVTTGGGIIANAFQLAALAVRFNFAVEERFMSYGYAEVAQCVADYTRTNRDQIVASVFDTVVGGLDLQENGMLDWDATGIAAAKAVAENNLFRGYDPANNQTAQFLVLAAFMTSASEPHTSYIASQQTASVMFDPDGVAAAVPVAIGALLGQFQVGGTSFSAGDLSAISNAYATAASNTTATAQATTAIATGVGLLASVAQQVAEAAITGVLSTAQAPSLLMPDAVTLNGTVRPLPAGWGIDRFPCNRATGLDVFREGDFDLPYRMKMLDRVSPYVYYFFTVPFLSPHKAASSCLNNAFVQPSKDGVYLTELDSAHVTDYQATNFAAFTAAEEAYLAAVNNGSSQTAAATTAFTAFVTNGGVRIDVTNPANSFALATAQGAMYLATTAGQAYTADVAAAIAYAAVAGSQIDTQFELIVSALFSFGYWYRPTYGTHSTSPGTLSEAQILALYNDAIKNANNPSITIAECIAHNTDTATLMGDPVAACFLVWAGSRIPYELSLGALEFNDATGDLVRIGSQRVAMNNFAGSHREFTSRLERNIGRVPDLEEREIIADDFELAAIEFLTPLWSQEAGSGFAAGEMFDGHSVFMTFSRSIGDVVEEAGKAEVDLLIGGFVCLLVYLFISASHFRSAVYSHGFLAVAGVLVICLATVAALGFSAYVGIKFTPISTNVVPFIAVGVGVDDILVVLTALHQAYEHKSSNIMKSTLLASGSSITFTSLTNFVVFAIASATPVNVIQYFCYQMLVSIFLNYFCILTMFIPLVSWDTRRIEKGNAERPRICTLGRDSSKDEAEMAEQPGFLERVFNNYVIPFTLSLPMRIFIVLGALTCIGLSAWQLHHIDLGTRISEIATEGTYQYEFTIRLEEQYTMYAGTLITLSDDMAATQSSILQAVDNLQQSEFVADSAPIADGFWLHSMLSQTTGSVTPVSDAEFYPTFATWLSAFGTTALNELDCIDSRTMEQVDCFEIVGAFDTPPATGSNPFVKLIAARGSFYIQGLRHTRDFTAAIESTRDAVDPVADAYSNPNDPGFEMFVFSYVHLFYEQYLHSFTNLYVIVGCGLAGIFVVTFIYQFSFTASLVLCVTIFLVVLELYALLPAIGINLNAFSLANICLAIGMAVEFTAHPAHQYLAVSGDRRERAAKSLSFMGVPLLRGCLSTVFAVLFISSSDTAFIRNYYFAMFISTILVSYLNGTFLLPVLLSFVGPTPQPHRHALEQTDVGDGIGLSHKHAELGSNDPPELADKITTV